MRNVMRKTPTHRKDMGDKVKEFFKDTEIHWLKLCGSLLLVFVAVYLPSVAEKSASSVIAVSAALSAVGGALLADSFITSKRFLKSIAPRLSSVNRLLATITSQISSIIIEEKQITEDNHAINRLSEIVPALRAIIADVSDLAGEKFDPNVLNETIESIAELVTQIESGAVKPNSEGVTDFLKGVMENLKQESPKGIISTAQCPYADCEGTNQVELGAYPSTSRVILCSKCGQKYHAHKTAAGTVQTKEWGGANKAAA